MILLTLHALQCPCRFAKMNRKAGKHNKTFIPQQSCLNLFLQRLKVLFIKDHGIRLSKTNPVEKIKKNKASAFQTLRMCPQERIFDSRDEPSLWHRACR